MEDARHSVGQWWLCDFFDRLHRNVIAEVYKKIASHQAPLTLFFFLRANLISLETYWWSYPWNLSDEWDSLKQQKHEWNNLIPLYIKYLIKYVTETVKMCRLHSSVDCLCLIVVSFMFLLFQGVSLIIKISRIGSSISF